MLFEKHIMYIDPDALIILVIVAVCAAGLLGVFGWMVLQRFRLRSHAERLEKAPDDIAPTELVHCRIVEKHSAIRYGASYRFPSHHVNFSVTFLTDENRRITLSVPEEKFPFLKEFAVGTLAVSTDRFIDFVPDSADLHPSPLVEPITQTK